MIHSENPFVDREDNPLRRFRGRLASPVTVITAGTAGSMTGLTVSSIFAIEGDPAKVYAAVGPNSDLFDTVAKTGRFVVHVCREGQDGAAEVFAGLRPSPGGLFAGFDWESSEWGPTLTAMPDRAFCSLISVGESGWSGVLIGSVDQVVVTDLRRPLVHFRGRYHTTSDQGRRPE